MPKKKRIIGKLKDGQTVTGKIIDPEASDNYAHLQDQNGDDILLRLFDGWLEAVEDLDDDAIVQVERKDGETNVYELDEWPNDGKAS